MSLFDLNKDWHRPSVWGDDDDDTFYRWTRRQSASKPSASTAPRAEKPKPEPEPAPEPEPEKEVEAEEGTQAVEAAVQGVDLAFDMSVKRVKTEITSSRQNYGQKIARSCKRLRAAIRAGPVSG